jgi:hypothetical protein
MGIAQEAPDKLTRTKPHDSISFIVETQFTLNGIPTNGKFDYERYIELLGKPDEERRGGPEIIAEHGCDDFMLSFSKNEIWAGLCLLSDAFIEEKGIDINGLEIGDSREKVENTFGINTKNRGEVWIRSNAVLILYFDAFGHIKKMHFSQVIT